MGKQLVLTAVQAARILGVGKSTIYRRTATGELASKTVDAKLVIPLSALKKDIDPAFYAALKADLEAGRVIPTNLATKEVKPAAKRPCKKACCCKKGAKK